MENESIIIKVEANVQLKNMNYNPYIIATVFKCLSVPKDNANCWIDLVLLYNVASHKSWESF